MNYLSLTKVARKKAFLNVVAPSDDSQQCGIGLCLIIGVLNEHLHFTADAL